jgi:enoyl-CoA hydratase/carnithine racemase
VYVNMDGAIDMPFIHKLRPELKAEDMLDPGAIAENFWHFGAPTPERVDSGARSQTVQGKVLTQRRRKVPMNKVRFEVSGALGILTLANPPLNLFSGELIEDLRASVSEASRVPIRALLVRADGKVFSGGADVTIFKGRTAGEARDRFTSHLRLIADLEELPFPTLAAVHGLCLAAGLELALACDLLWASASARLGQVEASIGTTTLLGGIQRLAERAGPARAREIAYTADQYDAATFERWNIVTRVVADEAFESETRAFAERLASGPTRAYTAGKRIVRAYLDAGVRKADALVDEIAPALFESDDMRAGVAAILEHGARGFRDKLTFRGS